MRKVLLTRTDFEENSWPQIFLANEMYHNVKIRLVNIFLNNKYYLDIRLREALKNCEIFHQ